MIFNRPESWMEAYPKTLMLQITGGTYKENGRVVVDGYGTYFGATTLEIPSGTEVYVISYGNTDDSGIYKNGELVSKYDYRFNIKKSTNIQLFYDMTLTDSGWSVMAKALITD